MGIKQWRNVSAGNGQQSAINVENISDENAA
jgi:hypothetical protein